MRASGCLWAVARVITSHSQRQRHRARLPACARERFRLQSCCFSPTWCWRVPVTLPPSLFRDPDAPPKLCAPPNCWKERGNIRTPGGDLHGGPTTAGDHHQDSCPAARPRREHGDDTILQLLLALQYTAAWMAEDDAFTKSLLDLVAFAEPALNALHPRIREFSNSRQFAGYISLGQGPLMAWPASAR